MATSGAPGGRHAESKDELISRALGLVEGVHGAQDEAFLRQYYRHLAYDDLVGRDPVDVVGGPLSHRELAATRPPGTATVRVFTPTVEAQGWDPGHSVVEVVTDDMSFLVDSVTSYLGQAGRSIYLVVHPVLRVSRSLTGELGDILDVDPDAALGVGEHAESWIHVEIDRETDPDVLVSLQAGLADVLREVGESVEDWAKMREAALGIADELASDPPPLPEAEVSEAWELLRWLADDHFTFLGYREYDLVGEGGDSALVSHAGSGLGILRHDAGQSRSFATLPPAVRAKAREPRLLVLTKANSRSPVHRPAYMDYVGVKRFDADGTVVGERRFLGLFTAAAYTESVLRIPVLRRKVREVLDSSGFPLNSHSGKDLLAMLEVYPRDELFQVDTESLRDTSVAVLHLQERRQTRLFMRRDAYGRFMSCLVYLPRDRYTTQVRLAMEALLREAFGASSVDYTARVSESVLARLHFVVRVPAGMALPDVDAAELERRLVEATRSWADDFAEALVDQCGEEEATRLLHTYRAAFPEAYKEDFPARTAVADLRQIEGLTPGEMALNLYSPIGGGQGERRFKIYRVGQPMSLSQVLPVLARMGVEVTDERPYEVDRGGAERGWVYDFGLRYPRTAVVDASLKERFQDGFAAVWEGRAESDGLNALVLTAGLTWRQTALLRAYVKYLRQIRSPYSQEYIEACLAANVDLTRGIVALFTARFDPDADTDRDAAQRAHLDRLTAALDDVASLDQDRILRSLIALVTATLRTTYFQHDDDAGVDYLAFKLDPAAVPDLPAPRPRFEIWVASPRLEGVHLRFGPVARGGLRWSDRREDFRTEVLGLVKAQAVKNAVIVPTGAKGGFVVKASKAAVGDRDAVTAEGVDRYRSFIAALLDLTDNRVGGAVVPPPRLVRHDGDDPYLVVAADKGTATFSDIANEVAGDYGFWLGDAFASGGSVGYDHKAMGITARGAWESVRRHFRELGRDIQSQPATVVGIGDMSGDVFGNGMLLSKELLLLAAFDHRHVFLDPTPDPAVSFAERQRLFALPRSSWADYDPALLSAGGGVFPRSAKAITVSPQVAAALGLPAAPATMTPVELIRAILLAPVDLLWNGGIGTYVKATSESHADAGDKANDAVRVDGAQLRAKVVGEGGNLGLTQRGRIEAARAGVRLNTDAIDNSAGVDTSDHEVNIKILLGAAVAAGDLTGKQRADLLTAMTDDVADHVLRDNYEQNVLLGNARVQAATMLPVHQRLVRSLELRGELDRELEALPSDAQFAALAGAGQGLTSPEFSVLVAYSKMALKADLLASDLPDQPYFGRVLREYFPPALLTRFPSLADEHPLRRQIVVTGLVNELVNRGGITFAFRAAEETGAVVPDLVRAATVSREVFALPAFWRRLESLDDQLPTRASTALYLECRRLLDRATRWFLQSRRAELVVEEEIARFAAVPDLVAQIPGWLRGGEAERLARRGAEYQVLGAPPALATETAALLDAFSLLDVVQIGQATGEAPADVGPVYFVLSERFAVDRMLNRITALPRDDRWEALARMALRYDLYAALAALTRSVLDSTPGGLPPDERCDAWEAANAEGLARARATLRDIGASESSDLAALSVALRVIRTLVPATSTR